MERLQPVAPSFRGDAEQTSASADQPSDIQQMGLDETHQAEGLPRYGIQWNGPTSPLPTLMPDGYWTPFHLAYELIRAQDQQVAIGSHEPHGGMTDEELARAILFELGLPTTGQHSTKTGKRLASIARLLRKHRGKS